MSGPRKDEPRGTSGPPGGDAAAVLRRRAEAIAAPVEVVRPRSPASLVLEAGGHRYALPVQRVRRILGPGPISAVPRGEHHLVGMRSANGEPVAVADLAAALQGRSTPRPEDCLVVVLDHTDPLGLLAERADVVDLDAAPVDQPGSRDVVAQVVQDGIAVLDTDRIIHDPRFRTGPRAGGSEPSTEGTRAEGARTS